MILIEVSMSMIASTPIETLARCTAFNRIRGQEPGSGRGACGRRCCSSGPGHGINLVRGAYYVTTTRNRKSSPVPPRFVSPPVRPGHPFSQARIIQIDAMTPLLSSWCEQLRAPQMVADQGRARFSLPTTQGAAPKFLDTLVSVGLATHE
jgi:hypothetical protein